MIDAARFTVDGGDSLEGFLGGVCAKARTGVCALMPLERVQGLLLGGGYGRGEGGVLRTELGDRPYNDLEFYLLLRGNSRLNERRHQKALRGLGHALEQEAGVDIEMKILSLRQLERAAPAMFYYDLVAGHRRLLGESNLLEGCGRHRQPENIPLSEAARLLMNRCSGLLFARSRLRRNQISEEDADFVFRNQSKVELALGDAILTCHRQYHASCRERRRRLRQLPGMDDFPMLDEIRRLYESGVEFKLHPRRWECGWKELRRRQESLTALSLEVWLWLEGRRLGRRFASPWDYAVGSENKCPETAPLRNFLVNVRTFGVGGALGAKAFRYPRERMLGALALLLWEPDRLAEGERLRFARRALRTRACDPEGLVEAYTALWRQFG